mmetsp:Transcript_22502/g.31384  ORF Transcript_22502/g.31384 Transcript_22502/m.31384 type:complete len:172 (+) Transcript_22502:57-572(+)
MSLSATTRRVATRVAHRNIDWSSPIFKGNAELAASVNQFRSWVASAEAMAEKYSAPPAPIDFAAAKAAVRDKALVDSLEKLYASGNPPAETHAWSTEDKADKAHQIEEAKVRQAFLADVVAETEKEIAFMKATRTTRDTDASDLKESYPDLAEEIENEIENREWFKDTVAK